MGKYSEKRKQYMREYRREYAQINRARLKEAAASYREKNRAAIKVKRASYREKNREKLRAKQYLYAQANCAKIMEYQSSPECLEKRMIYREAHREYYKELATIRSLARNPYLMHGYFSFAIFIAYNTRGLTKKERLQLFHDPQLRRKYKWLKQAKLKRKTILKMLRQNSQPEAYQPNRTSTGQSRKST